MKINSNKYIIPPFLAKDATIEIAASARFITEKDLNLGIKFIQEQGFKVKYDASIFVKENIFAGSISQRVDMLQSAFDSKDSQAILFARGGYGTIQLIDLIDFSKFFKNPKWLIGFSDITIILMHIYTKYQIMSIHAPMIFNFSFVKKNNINQLFNFLRGDVEKSIIIAYNHFNINGKSAGTLIGGNLSIIYSILSSPSFPKMNKDFILFIEDTDEYIYHIERIMYSLDRSGLLNSIKGLIVGQMTNIKDNKVPFGKSAYLAIKDVVQKYNFPVCFNFPSGHGSYNMPIIIGSEIELQVNKDNSKIFYKI